MACRCRASLIAAAPLTKVRSAVVAQRYFNMRAFLQKASKVRSFDGYVSPVLAVFNSTSVSRSHEFNHRMQMRRPKAWRV